jgi:phenylacetate-CoA ligase
MPYLRWIAQKEKINLHDSAIQRIIVAGEPGGSIPGTKSRIEEAWDAKLYDHTGATEVGAHGFTCVAQTGVHLNEGEFVVEVLDPLAGQRMKASWSSQSGSLVREHSLSCGDRVC